MRIWALVAVLALGFAQVAMAMSFCAMSPLQMSGAAAGGGDCAQADPGAKHRCLRMCQDEPQKGDAPALAAIPPAIPAGIRVVTVRVPAVPGGVDREFLLARTTAPPPNLLFARFLE
jgi:hypothetical protein